MKLPESKFKLTLVTTVAVFLVAVSICQVFEWMGFPEQDQVKMIKEMAGWRWKFVGIVAWILLATPVIEETLFRYCLFRLPARLLEEAEPPCFFDRRPTLAVAIISSAVFSFAHYIDFGALLAGKGFALLPVSNACFALFVVGLAWCWLYFRTKSIWCSMLSHSLFNTINLVLALSL